MALDTLHSVAIVQSSTPYAIAPFYAFVCFSPFLSLRVVSFVLQQQVPRFIWHPVRKTSTLVGRKDAFYQHSTTPDQYELGEVPSLTVERPTDILIKVHAASINPIDVKKAAGATKAVLKDG